jgi:hypothetical protein
MGMTGIFKTRLSERSLRAPTHLPRQRAESHPFEDKLDPEQHTEQPDCCRGEVSQKIIGRLSFLLALPTLAACCSFRNSSGSFAKFAAICGASSWVSIFAVDRRLGS